MISTRVSLNWKSIIQIANEYRSEKKLQRYSNVGHSYLAIKFLTLSIRRVARTMRASFVPPGSQDNMVRIVRLFVFGSVRVFLRTFSVRHLLGPVHHATSS